MEQERRFFENQKIEDLPALADIIRNLGYEVEESIDPLNKQPCLKIKKDEKYIEVQVITNTDESVVFGTTDPIEGLTVVPYGNGKFRGQIII
ncbi:MAG: hypothetical protein WC784_05830 [Candidatus Shapirobacteria bacterium]|jgi:hypothetical protein